MSKMSPEERQRRRDKVAAQALESLAKSEQFNFRIDAQNIKRLYAVADEQKKSVGAMVRQWVIERLDQEQQAPTPSELMEEIQALREETTSGFKMIHEAVSSYAAGKSKKSASASKAVRKKK